MFSIQKQLNQTSQFKEVNCSERFPSVSVPRLHTLPPAKPKTTSGREFYTIGPWLFPTQLFGVLEMILKPNLLSCCKASSSSDSFFAVWGQCCKTFYVRDLRIFVISLSVCPWQAFPDYSNKHTSLVQKFVNYGQKSSITLTPKANVIEHFTAIIYQSQSA